jgi:hypothetical protein
MEKMSGLVLDVYDDPEGNVLKSVFPAYEDVPGIIKEAHALTQEEQAKLPDDVFALILVDGETSLRKYACVDGGNTAMAVEYFMINRHKLPAEAQKVAAANLCKACGWFDIDPPEELEKIAIGPLGLLTGALVLPGAAKETKKNLAVARAAGGQVITPQQMKAQRMRMGY